MVHERLHAWSGSELREAWPLLAPDDRREGFLLLSRGEAEGCFLSLNASDQAELLLALPPGERRLWLRLLAPDDAADVIQAAPPVERAGLLALLEDTTRTEVTALLAYAEDEAGGLMNPRYARVRPDMSVDEAISYLKSARKSAGGSRARKVSAWYRAYGNQPQARCPRRTA
jgi:magnesium transporter